MIDDLRPVVKRHHGDKAWSPFSDEEMSRRQNALRMYMAENAIDAALLTSHHNICYYSGFLYCYFGRKYGMVINEKEATTITAAIDGGQPWRRTFGDNVTYTDWRKDNFFVSAQQITRV
jgi:creatinase